MSAPTVATQLSRAQMIDELRKCKKDPIYFMHNYVKVMHPTLGQVPLVLYPYQHAMIDAIHNNKESILLCSRQMGKTTLMAAYAGWFGLFNMNMRVLIVSNKAENASDIMDKIKYIYEFLPAWMKPYLKINNRREIILDNNSIIKAQATSATSGRGSSISLLLLDEFAFVKSTTQIAFWASIYPTISTGGKLVIASTPNGDTDTFYQLWQNALSGELAMYPVFIKWNMHPDRDENWKKKQIAALGVTKFKQEYELEFITVDNTLIDSMTLSRLITVNPIINKNQFRFWRRPDAEEVILIGIDTSGATGADNTVIQCISLNGLDQICEFSSNTMSNSEVYPIFKWVIKLFNSFGCEVKWSIECNQGGTNFDVLYDMDDDFPEATFVRERTSKGRKAFGMYTSNASKKSCQALLKHLLEKNILKIFSGLLIGELKTFVLNPRTEVYSSKAGKRDDSVLAMYICLRLLLKELAADEELFKRVYDIDTVITTDTIINEIVMKYNNEGLTANEIKNAAIDAQFEIIVNEDNKNEDNERITSKDAIPFFF